MLGTVHYLINLFTKLCEVGDDYFYFTDMETETQELRACAKWQTVNLSISDT